MWNPFQQHPIEKGIPPPASTVPSIPWEKMEVGDSVFVPEEDYPRKYAQKLTWRARQALPDRKWTSRFGPRDPDDPDSPLGTRIWRIE